jgi:hypothetical protein
LHGTKSLRNISRLGNQRKEFGYFEKYNKNRQVIAYEHLKRASLFISRSFKVAMSQISLWIIAWLIYIPNVGTRRRLGDHSKRCTHAIWSLGLL